MNYQYQRSKWPFHKCQICGRRIKRNDDSVVKYFLGSDLEIWFCSKECAREDYLWFRRLAEGEEELDDYIKGTHGR